MRDLSTFDSAWSSTLFTSRMHLDGFEIQLVTQEEWQVPATKTAGPGVDAPLKNEWRIVALSTEKVDGTQLLAAAGTMGTKSFVSLYQMILLSSSRFPLVPTAHWFEEGMSSMRFYQKGRREEL